MPTQIFKPEGAGPRGKPLRGAKGGGRVTRPTGVSDRLVLRAYGTESVVYHKRAIGNPLRGITPESQRTLTPPDVSRQLIEFEEGKHVAKRILVAGLVRG